MLILKNKISIFFYMSISAFASIAIFIIAIIFSPLYGYPFTDGIPSTYSQLIILCSIYLICFFSVLLFKFNKKNRRVLENYLLVVVLSLVIIFLSLVCFQAFSISLSPLISIAFILFNYLLIHTNDYIFTKISELNIINSNHIKILLSTLILILIVSSFLFVHNGAHS